jgi:hypothetical protein
MTGPTIDRLLSASLAMLKDGERRKKDETGKFLLHS